jgi:hypothetical protein
VLLVAVVPVVYSRYSYTRFKRLREVSPGKLYRSGCLTVAGFRDAIELHGIRTIINLMEEAPDPDLRQDYFSGQTLSESDLCAEYGIRYVPLTADLVWRPDVPSKRPAAIDTFLKIMDNPANYPVLIHCRAGLHRTGVLVAVYRMEYGGWSAAQAVQEMKYLGFGEFACTAANDYIVQYILTYHPGERRNAEAEVQSGQPDSADHDF